MWGLLGPRPMRGIGIQLENDIASQEQMMCESHTFYYNAMLYIPITLNIDLILWQTQLIVCAVKS